MILNNASYAKHNGDEIAFMKLDGVIVFRNRRLRCVEYTVDDNRVNPLNYSNGNGLPLLYKSADDYSTDYYELIEITLKDGTITTDVTTRCDLISKVKVWWPSSVIGISFAHGTTKLVKSINYVHILPSFKDYYPFVENNKTYDDAPGDSTIKSLNVSNWEVGNPGFLFKDLGSLTTLTGINQWDTSESTDMKYAFFDCKSLTTLDLSGWNTSNIVSMLSTFKNCTSLTTLGDISTWDTRKVRDMKSMFCHCSKLTSLDLSGWHTDSVAYTAYMFDGCEALTSLDIRNFDFGNITSNYHDMFRDCYALKEIRLNNCDSNTISKIISSSAGLPREAFADGTKGKLYVKRENVANLEEPDNWQFVYVN